jgi:hypothetical protein
MYYRCNQDDINTFFTKCQQNATKNNSKKRNISAISCGEDISDEEESEVNENFDEENKESEENILSPSFNEILDYDNKIGASNNLTQSVFQKSIQDLSDINIKVRKYTGESAVKIVGNLTPADLVVNVKGVLKILSANGIESVRDSLHSRRYYVIIGGRAIYLDYHFEIILFYMFFIISEKGLKSSNPYDEAIRDLADEDLFDDGRILTLRFIDIFQRNEILKTYFSKIYENWKSRLKKLVTSHIDNLRSLFPELTFDPNTFIKRPVILLF